MKFHDTLWEHALRMPWFAVFVFIAIFTLHPHTGITEALDVVSEGVSRYTIIISKDASPSTSYAAQELQTHIFSMTGVKIPIRDDSESMQPYEIILGYNRHLASLDMPLDFGGLGKEGYLIKTVGPHIVISGSVHGGGVRGDLYGVYGLLEDCLGIRWFTRDVTKIPRSEKLVIPHLDERVVPVFEYREPYVWEAFDGDWAARNRVNRNSKNGGLEARHGGKIEWVPSMFAHTFAKLVPPERFFRSHPEYFSLVGGKRNGKRTQLCCTNDDVVRIATDAVLEAFRNNPQADIISVSQNDWANYCECYKCRALAEREGSQMAPVLSMVNRIAEAVEKEFPGKRVETLAYQWSRKPPKSLRPRDNVVIRLCTIECCFSHAFNDTLCPRNRSFAQDLEAWSGVAGNLWVWNYVTSFDHYLIPFPDMMTRDDDLRFFSKNNVKGVFQQDVYSTPCGELSDVSAYLNAKLLWNPCRDSAEVIREFVEYVYGAASKPILDYIDLIHDAASCDSIHIGIWQGPDAGYLTDEVLSRADSLFTEAERAAAYSPDVLERVKCARLSIDYAIIEKSRNTGKAFVIDQQTERLTVESGFSARIDRFCSVAASAGILKLKEFSMSPGDYRAMLEKKVHSRSLTPLEPHHYSGLEPGVEYRFLEGTWTKKNVFENIEGGKQGTTGKLTIPFTGTNTSYRFILKGCIAIKEDGVYLFSTVSDGYSVLMLGEKTIVENGGLDPVRERCGFVSLRKGYYPITVVFATKDTGRRLTVFYAPPGGGKEGNPAGCAFQTEVMQAGNNLSYRE